MGCRGRSGKLGGVFECRSSPASTSRVGVVGRYGLAAKRHRQEAGSERVPVRGGDGLGGVDFDDLQRCSLECSGVFKDRVPAGRAAKGASSGCACRRSSTWPAHGPARGNASADRNAGCWNWPVLMLRAWGLDSTFCIRQDVPPVPSVCRTRADGGPTASP